MDTSLWRLSRYRLQMYSHENLILLQRGKDARIHFTAVLFVPSNHKTGSVDKKRNKQSVYKQIKWERQVHILPKRSIDTVDSSILNTVRQRRQFNPCLVHACSSTKQRILFHPYLSSHITLTLSFSVLVRLIVSKHSTWTSP